MLTCTSTTDPYLGGVCCAPCVGQYHSNGDDPYSLETPCVGCHELAHTVIYQTVVVISCILYIACLLSLLSLVVELIPHAHNILVDAGVIFCDYIDTTRCYPSSVEDVDGDGDEDVHSSSCECDDYIYG
ncbi:hypothetical protein NE237_025126 [Protea cynaroides]|uniref:Uncharacterized protein n=1 Tax=Protea cynaroides TaxID=273540 RepID=A0A9Q0H4N0_9MAGN|nr:hypothetical protein NE237_025126 [Protea cynaroides]